MAGGRRRLHGADALGPGQGDEVVALEGSGKRRAGAWDSSPAPGEGDIPTQALPLIRRRVPTRVRGRTTPRNARPLNLQQRLPTRKHTSTIMACSDTPQTDAQFRAAGHLRARTSWPRPRSAPTDWAIGDRGRGANLTRLPHPCRGRYHGCGKRRGAAGEGISVVIVRAVVV